MIAFWVFINKGRGNSIVQEFCPICSSKSRVIKKSRQYDFQKCDGCGVYYCSPFPRDYLSIYDDYDFNKNYRLNYYEYLPHIIHSLEKKLILMKRIFPELSFDKQIKLLDVGCGIGFYVHAAKLLGFDSYGIDIDKKSIEIAKGIGLKVELSDILDLEFRNNYFDIIKMKQVLEHLPNPSHVLRKIYYLLKKDGVLIIDVPNQDGIIPRIKILIKIKPNEYGFVQPPRHLFGYTKDSLKNILRIAGFKKITIGQSWPGDPVFYPILGQNILNKTVFKMSYILGKGSLLYAYAKSSQ